MAKDNKKPIEKPIDLFSTDEKSKIEYTKKPIKKRPKKREIKSINDGLGLEVYGKKDKVVITAKDKLSKEAKQALTNVADTFLDN